MQHPHERSRPHGRDRGSDRHDSDDDNRNRGQGRPRRRQTYSLARTNAVVLHEVDSVELGVSLHKADNGQKDIRLWTRTKDGCWVELIDEQSSAEAFTTDETQCPVTFKMVIIDQSEMEEVLSQIDEIRVFAPITGGKVAWYHAEDWRSATQTLVLARDSNGEQVDDMVEAPFVVRVLDEDGNWWGQDPYVRIIRITTPPTETTCGP